MRQAQLTELDTRLETDSTDYCLEAPPRAAASTLPGNDGRLVGPRALMLAVLEDAIHCADLLVQERRPERRQLRHRARLWIRSRDRDWLFSFESICDALQIDARRLRRRILNEGPVAPAGGRRRRIHGLPRQPKKLKRA